MLGCMNKKITRIEDLAVMIEGEFRRIDGRFDNLEMRMDTLEDRIDTLEREMKKLSVGLRADIAQLRKDFKDADTRTAVIAIELRVSALEKKVDLSSQKI